MTELLLKKFIPNYENVGDKTVRNRYGFLSAAIGIICNIILFVAKFFVGYVSSSVSVMTDSFNNLSDVSSSLVVLFGFKISNRPADKQHPFGYGRTEYLATLLISVIIMYIGYDFLKQSIHDIFSPSRLNLNFVSLFILITSLAIKLWLSIFNKKLADKINSKTLLATSIDCKNDVIVTSTTIFSLLFTYLTNIIIDGYVGVVISFLFIFSGFSIMKETVSTLLGEPSDPELISKIKNAVKNYDGILGVHDLIVHNYGPNKIMASIHAEVPNDMKISACHDIIERAEKEISRNFDLEIIIHTDPIAVDDPRIAKFSSEVINHLKSLGKDFEAHDFRLVDGADYINFIFDLKIPFDYKKDKMCILQSNLQKKLESLEPKIICIVNFETGYS